LLSVALPQNQAAKRIQIFLLQVGVALAVGVRPTWWSKKFEGPGGKECWAVAEQRAIRNVVSNQ
jgi:hypothetical protein